MAVEKIQRVRILSTCFDRSVPRYVAGKHYPLNHETNVLVLGGNATLVEVDMQRADHDSDVKAMGTCDGAEHHRGTPRTLPGRD